MRPAGIARSPARRAGAVIAALLLPHAVSHAQAAPVAPRADTATVILLGTGMPYPDPSAQGPATAVTVGDRLFLFDAGAGVVRQMNAAKLPVRGGPVTAVFLTHLHSDHTLGLADVIFTSWVMGRRRPLPIIGPPGTRAMVDHLTAAYTEDIEVRTRGLERGIPDGWRTRVREVTGGVVYDSAGVRILAVPVEHGSWKHAFGFRIEAPGKVIVLSGDTRPSAALERAAAGADLLVHEAYPGVRLKPEDRPGGDLWPQYMRAFHASDEEVGRLAARAGVKQLVLHHLVRMGGTDAELLEGVRRGGYLGPAVIGKDLDRF